MANCIINRLYLPERSRQAIKDALKGENSAIDYNRVLPRPKSLDIEACLTHQYYIQAYLTAASMHSGVTVEGVEKLSDEEVDKMFALAGFQTVDPDVSIFLTEEALQKQYDEYGFDLNLRDFCKPAKRCKDMAEFCNWGKTMLENKAKYGSFDWYQWSVINWGCKWNASDVEDREDYLSWTSPWSPPFGVITALSKRFPKELFVFGYLDEDPYNNGIFSIIDGEMTFYDNQDLYRTYEDDVEDEGEVGGEYEEDFFSVRFWEEVDAFNKESNKELEMKAVEAASNLVSAPQLTEA